MGLKVLKFQNEILNLMLIKLLNISRLSTVIL